MAFRVDEWRCLIRIVTSKNVMVLGNGMENEEMA